MQHIDILDRASVITGGEEFRTLDIQLGKIPRADRKTVKKPRAFNNLTINGLDSLDGSDGDEDSTEGSTE